MVKKIELLAPAKNKECGIEAVNNGADALYIGADRFGARAAARNSLSDIEKLCNYAHQYYAKVYVTLNTILTDKELEEARRLIYQLYEIGVDALIIQDMGILMLDIPPIPLHASTQTDNRTIEKIKLLEESGIERVVLARELSLEQITEISSQTDIDLEAFVYGAVCVSYSGQCYISQYCTGRSANRGECAQFCRLPYSLLDAQGKTLIRNKHLLSLQDMDRTADLKNMIQAGVSSFKIEGRLKDMAYVKNVTSWFRQHLDAIIEEKNLNRTSSGKEFFTFQPHPEKTFHRGASDYFLYGRNQNSYWFDTPKSMGEEMGIVENIEDNALTIKGNTEFSNGDGLCFFNREGELEGFRVNRVENGRLFPDTMPQLSQGTRIYRNYDHAFHTLLLKRETKRQIAVDVIMEERDNGFNLTFSDEDANTISFFVAAEKQKATKEKEAMENTKRLFGKLGNTAFYLRSFRSYFSQPWFIPSSLISQWKTEGVTQLMEERCRRFEQSKKEEYRIRPKKDTRFFDNQSLNYLCNVLNSKACTFYQSHGALKIAPAMEQETPPNPTLMHCKYCVKYMLRACPKEKDPVKLSEPLYLKHKQLNFILSFDCNACEMKVETE